jgi:hypothetical protein
MNSSIIMFDRFYVQRVFACSVWVYQGDALFRERAEEMDMRVGRSHALREEVCAMPRTPCRQAGGSTSVMAQRHVFKRLEVAQSDQPCAVYQPAPVSHVRSVS